LGREASWASAGLLAPVTEAGFRAESLLNFHIANFQLWDQFANEVAGHANQELIFNTGGILKVAFTPYDLSLLERRTRLQRQLGFEVEELDAQALREEEPFLSGYALAGTICRQEGWVDPRQLVETLISACQSLGVQLQSEEPVQQLVGNEERITGVRTHRGETTFDWVVLAAGAWSGQIEGLPGRDRPPVRPVRGQIVLLTGDEIQLTRPIWGPGAYLVPRDKGRILVGATEEEKGFDNRVTAEGVRLLLEGAFEILPATAEMELADSWAGLRPASRDEGPILGPGLANGLVHASGHFRNGILGLPVTAEAIAATIRGDSVPAVAQPFHIQRFLSHEERPA